MALFWFDQRSKGWSFLMSVSQYTGLVRHADHGKNDASKPYECKTAGNAGHIWMVNGCTKFRWIGERYKQLPVDEGFDLICIIWTDHTNRVSRKIGPVQTLKNQYKSGDIMSLNDLRKTKAQHSLLIHLTGVRELSWGRQEQSRCKLWWQELTAELSQQRAEGVHSDAAQWGSGRVEVIECKLWVIK